MIKKNNFLSDKDFLIKLHTTQQREIFAKIITLTWDEKPLEQVEGKITNGNINIDGSSSMRRSCSLTMVAENVDLSNFHWGFKTKIKLEIGLKNIIDNRYSNICWFKQGLFVITNLSISSNTNSYTISINCKDKMCLINGEIGGKLPYSIDWGIEDRIEYEKDENGDLKKDTYKIYHDKIPIKTIIKEAIQNYGNELAQNVIINDVEDYGYEMIDYKGDTTMYLFYHISQRIYDNMTLNGDTQCYIVTDQNGDNIIIDSDNPKKISAIPNYYNGAGNSLFNIVENPTKVVFFTTNINANSVYYIAKMEYGNAIGYRQVDLTYAGDLITNVGDTLVTMLDKIKQMLGDFEYFYDIDGRFIFQKKPNYIDHTWNNLEGSGQSTSGDSDTSPIGIINVVASGQENGGIAYSFYNDLLITSFSNQPNLANVKNDYIIWGKRQGISGNEIPIHIRYAICQKPKYYYSLQEDKWYISDFEEIPNSIKNLSYVQYDWRELIYKMGVDYQGWGAVEGQEATGPTGYHRDDLLIEISKKNRYIDDDGKLVILYPTGKTGYEQYYTDLLNGTGPSGRERGYWRYLYDPNPEESLQDRYYANHWTKTIDEPENLIFWFDFLDPTGSELEKYSVNVIGDRTDAVNDDTVKAISYREVPNVLFNKLNEGDTPQPGYIYINLPDSLSGMFSLTRRGKSAINLLDQKLYSNSYCTETVSINALPIYMLEPNTRISIHDEKTNIDGDYIIQRLSLQLSHNGTMSISGYKVINTLQ